MERNIEELKKYINKNPRDFPEELKEFRYWAKEFYAKIGKIKFQDILEKQHGNELVESYVWECAEILLVYNQYLIEKHQAGNE